MGDSPAASKVIVTFAHPPTFLKVQYDDPLALISFLIVVNVAASVLPAEINANAPSNSGPKSPFVRSALCPLM